MCQSGNLVGISNGRLNLIRARSFKRCMREYGTFGGRAFGLLIGDYAFGRESGDLSLLAQISNVAAAAHTPYISEMAISWGGISPMCDCSSSHLQKIFFLRSIARRKKG